MSPKKLSLVLAVVLIASMLLSACATPPAAPAPAPQPTTAPAVVEPTKAPAAEPAKAAEPAAKPKKDPKDIKIAFSGFSGTNEFWLTLARSAEAQAKSLGVQFINLTTETQDAEAQKRAVDTAIKQGVDAVIIGATDSRGWGDTLEKAKAAGIGAIAVDTAIDNPVIASLIQTDNVSAAGLAGDFLCQQMGGKGKALVLGGTVGHQTGDARKNGVENKLKACGVTVISDYSNWDENTASQLAQNTLTANADLGAIFVAFDPGAAAAASVVDQKGLTGKVMVVGFDALPVMLDRIKAGTATATVRQDPATMGKEGINLALKVINGEKVEAKTLIPGELITKANVDQFLKK